MGDISKNFSRFEFECKCRCGFNTVDVELLKVLQEDIRNHYNKKVTITSGCRCFMSNMHILGAAKDSYHVKAQAADFKVDGVDNADLYRYLHVKFRGKYGIGLYSTHVHLDVRNTEARWKKV